MDIEKAEKWTRIFTFFSCIGPVLFTIGIGLFFYIWIGAGLATQKAYDNPVSHNSMPTEPNQVSNAQSTQNNNDPADTFGTIVIISSIFILGVSPIFLIIALCFVGFYHLEITKLLKFSLVFYAFLIFYYGKQVINFF